MLVSDSQYKKLSEELTYEVPSNVPDRPIIIKNLTIVNNKMPDGKKLVSFPSGRTDLIPNNYEIVDKRFLNPVKIPLSADYEPRDSQQAYLDFCDDSHILNAKPGWGKSIAALFAASKLGQKTLIIVHTVALRNQWEREIIKVTGLKPGVIGSGKYNVDSPIVVTNTQSILKHLNKIKHMFGTMILDEMHHVASPTFTKIVNGLFCRYKIGLTGTLRRKDGKHVVFADYFGHKKFVPKEENIMKPLVEVHSPPFKIPSASTWAERINMLTQDYDYIGYVIAMADKYVKKGHQVLIVSDRTQFLKFAEAISPNPSVCVTGIDDREKAHRQIRSGQARELWGSINIYSEGISLNSLSCVILACPINNDVRLEQVMARVNREHPGKLWPIVADIKFADHTGINQFRNRMTFYRQEGFKVKFVENIS